MPNLDGIEEEKNESDGVQDLKTLKDLDDFNKVNNS
jgi:hypothetical protein